MPFTLREGGVLFPLPLALRKPLGPNPVHPEEARRACPEASRRAVSKGERDGLFLRLI